MSTQEARISLFRERIFPVVFMFLITAFFIAIVSGIYLATRESVLRNELLYVKRAVLFAVGIPVPEDPVAIESLFAGRIREIPSRNASGEVTGVEYYEVTDARNDVIGYVIPATGPGLWGEIDAVIGFDASLATIIGIDFTKHSETPGLGGRISEEWFREQFRGKSAPLTRVPEGTDGESRNEFDAITGATITSTAVEGIVNATQASARRIVGGER